LSPREFELWAKCDVTLDLLGSDPNNERVKGRNNYVLLTMLLMTCKDKLG